MSFLTSREITLSEKLTRVVKAPFRTSGLGQDVMNDLEYGGNTARLSSQDGPSKKKKKKGASASPEDIPMSPRSSISMEAVDSTPQMCWNIKDPRFVNVPADEDEAWQEGANLVERHDAAECQVSREIIDTLLVFAGLFSGVATAFIIESYRWLLEEPDDLSAEYLRQILALLSNSTIPAIPQVSGRPSLPNDVVTLINSLWFTSLTLSLSSALVCIVSKQWLREYQRDAGRSHITNLSVRQVKYQGLTRWYVSAIITSIPLLLQAALFIFLIGVVYLLWHIQPIVAGIVSGLALFVAIFFIATTVLPAFQFILGWAGYLRLHTTNQFPFKSAQAWIFLLMCTLIMNLFAWIYHHFISMRGFRFGYSFDAPFPMYASWPQLDLAWTRRRDDSARQCDEPTSIGLCVGFMELNFEHRRLRDWIWGCLWSLRNHAANAKYVLQCVRRTPDLKSDFPSRADELANEVIPLLHPRLLPEATSELVLLSILSSADKGAYGEARIEHLIRLFNSLIHRDPGEVPVIVYYTLQSTLRDTANDPLGHDTRRQLLIVAQSILRRSQHTEDLFESSFLELITTIVTYLSGGELPEDTDAWIMDRDLCLELSADIMDWLERYPDPASNWEDYKSRVVWSVHITVLFARVLSGFKPVEPDNLQVNHRRFPVIYELSQFVFEKARPIPSDVLPTWAPDKSDMEEFARVKVAIEEAAQTCPSLAAPLQARRTTDGTPRHGVHWEDGRTRNGSAPTEMSSQPTDSDATNIISVAGGAGSGSMSPEGTLTERTASASGSLGSQGRGNDEGVEYENSESAVKGEAP